MFVYVRLLTCTR